MISTTFIGCQKKKDDKLHELEQQIDRLHRKAKYSLVKGSKEWCEIGAQIAAAWEEGIIYLEELRVQPIVKAL